MNTRMMLRPFVAGMAMAVCLAGCGNYREYELHEIKIDRRTASRTDVSQPAALNVLCWLQEQQAEDGGWGDVAGERAAVTSLGILAFLASGESPCCNGNHNLFGVSACDHPVAKACEFLSRCDQLKETGLEHKCLGRSPLNLPLAAFALAETYGMTRNPAVKESAQRLLARVASCDCDVQDGESRDPAMWSALALRAAKYARIEVDSLDERLKRLESALEQCNYEASGYYGDLRRFRAAFGPSADKSDMAAWVEWKKAVRKTFRDSFVETGTTPDGRLVGYCRLPAESPDSTGLGAVADSALVVMKDAIGGNGRRNLPVFDNPSTNGADCVEVEVDI